MEIKVYKQKVKHLLYEHQNTITTLKADTEIALKQREDGRQRSGELTKDKRDAAVERRQSSRTRTSSRSSRWTRRRRSRC